MEYKIRHLNWYKRRIPTREPKPIHASVTNIELINNSYCDMLVIYDDGDVFKFNSRVSQNPINKAWTVHGMCGATGRQCLVDVIE